MNKQHRVQVKRTPIASAVLLALCGAATPVQAQTTESAPKPPPPVVAQAQTTESAVAQAQTPTNLDKAPSPAAEPKLQSILVTANRRIEKLENVPQSISVVSEAEILRNNVREFQDLVDLMPSLTISTGTQVGTNSINMRGIGTTSNNLGIEGDVAVVLDDLPFAQPQQAFRDLHDVARIEVLKGPQSTLFGKSAIAGAVIITTAPIGYDPLKGRVSTFLSSDHEYRVSAMVSGRVTDKVGIRFAASKSEFRGLLHNLTNDSYVNGSGGSNFNGKIEWNVSNLLDVALTAFYSDTVTEGNTSALIFWDGRDGSLIRNNVNLNYANVYRGITPGIRNRDVRLDDETSLAQKDLGVALRANYNFPSGSFLADHTLTSITGLNKNDSNDKRDNDSHDLVIAQYLPITNAAGVTGTAPSGIMQTAKINGLAYIKTYTQELRLTSPDTGKFRYLAGLWYMSTALDRYYLRGIYGIKPTNYTNYETTSDIRDVAIYANSTWEFMPNHTLTLGGRWNQETNNYTFTTISALASTAPANTPYAPFYYYKAPQHSEGAFTGKAAYAYNIHPGTMVYASYATGRKGVAYDMTSGANNRNVFNFLPLAAETARSYELGLKSNLMNNRATVTAALFQTDFRNYQASSTQTFSDGTSASVLFGIGGVQTKGAEIDFRALVTNELSLSASYAYTEAIVTAWQYGACYSGRTDCILNPPNPANPTASYVNGAGFVMPNAPRHRGTLGAEYLSRLGPFKAGYHVQARSQSNVKGNINQDPAQDRAGFTVVDAGFSLGTSNNKYKVAFGVKNLADRPYATGGLGNIVTLQAPTGAASSANVVNAGWKPARDAFRYYTIRFDASF
ncbi:MAG TPA: TonB-dependent receptor [Vicinamibacterales bacterium]|nr:TonB-dependent receptor [Vicinamibacterales bacterium]